MSGVLQDWWPVIDQPRALQIVLVGQMPSALRFDAMPVSWTIGPVTQVHVNSVRYIYSLFVFSLWLEMPALLLYSLFSQPHFL